MPFKFEKLHEHRSLVLYPRSAIIDAQPQPERLVATAGVTIALCILGDSFLYGMLPLEYKNLGLALPMVGVLLSVNRLVRLISNTWASAVFERLGPKLPFALAAALGLVTTMLYGVGWGFAVFLLGRLGWGIAWSALRQGGYQAAWTGGENAKGRLMGLLWGLIRLGSAFSVVLGGYLRDRFGYQVAIMAVMGLTALALPIAFWMRWPEHTSQRDKVIAPNGFVSALDGWRAALKTRAGRQLLMTASMETVFEGVVISTTSLFLANRLGTSELLSGLGIRVGTLAGLLLAIRWTSDMLFGPSIGALSDRLGQRRMLVLLVGVLMVAIVGVVNLSGIMLVACVAIMFVTTVGLNITLHAVANGVAMQSKRPHLFVGVYNTAIDGGSAVGPLLAYSVGGWLGMSNLYLVAAGALTIAVLMYWQSARQLRFTVYEPHS